MRKTFAALLLFLPAIALAGQVHAAVGPIKAVRGVKPKRSAFKPAGWSKPLVIRSQKAAAEHFAGAAVAALNKQVDFKQQVVLVFAWRGSGQDRLAFTVAESYPEQVFFTYRPGRTRDLRPHVRVYALRSNVRWRGPKGRGKPAAGGGDAPVTSAKPGQVVRVHDTSANPFIMPQNGKEVGDPFPVYWDGVWHVYALSAGLKQVFHLTSTDLVKWAEHKPAMVGKGIATGTVVRHENKFYMFYTDAGPQTIRLVVSDNPWHFDFTKSKLVARADNKVYQLSRRKFRDCYVFHNEKEKLWWMLVEATSDNSVAVGLFKSKDLLTWTQHDPIFKDKARRHGSCPQVFEQAGRWYLTCLDYGTWYYSADAVGGPWKLRGQYHSKFLTAASRHATDGKRHLCWGFFSKHKTPERNHRGYAGPLSVGREMVLSDEGSLGVRPLPELIAAIRKPAGNAKLFDCAKRLSGKWDVDAAKQELRCTDEGGGVLLLDLPGKNGDYYFEVEIELSSPESKAEVVVRTSENLDRGYRIAIEPGKKKIAIRQAKPNGGTFNEKDYTPAKGKPARLKLFVCGNQIEAFLDDRASLSARVLDRSQHKVAIQIAGGRATMRKPLLHHFKYKEDK